jgi:hypothetical protein
VSDESSDGGNKDENLDPFLPEYARSSARKKAGRPPKTSNRLAITHEIQPTNL